MDSLHQQPATATRPVRMLEQGGNMKLVREIPDSDSQEEWLARERAHLSQVLYRYTPLVIDHAQGSYLYTVEGRRYLDFASGIAVTNLGHGHPVVIEAAKAQNDTVAHAIFAPPLHPALPIAGPAVDVAHGELDTVFFVT